MLKRSATNLDRRAFLTALAAGGAAASLLPISADAAPLATRAIPASIEPIPIIGMGSWITLNVGNDPDLRAARLEVVQAFFDEGGGMIDSSPMYGSSEEVIGHCLTRIPNKQGLFSATKVWTLSQFMGIRQMNNSFDLWGLEQFDLMQIHNLVDWEAHLETFAGVEARRPRPICRHHHVAWPSPRRPGGDHEKAAARFRPILLQHDRSRGGAASPAAGTRPRDCRDRQSPLPNRRPVRQL